MTGPREDSAASQPVPEDSLAPVAGLEPGQAPVGVVLPQSDWQPAPRWEPPPPPVAQPKNSPVVVLAVIGMVVALVLGLAMAGGTNDEVKGTAIAAVTLLPTSSSVSPPVPTAPPAPTAPPTTAPATPSSTPRPRPSLTLETNPLLAPGMDLPKVTCTLPKIGRDEAKMRAFHEAGITCLGDAWRPVLDQVNQPFEVPKLDLANAPKDSCVGELPPKEQVTGFYCDPDNTIFLPLERIQEMGLNPGDHLALLAHEYGHHIQRLSGLSDALLIKSEPFKEDSPEYLEVTRRKELQAECFAGMFIASATGRGSVTTGIGKAAVEGFSYGENSKTHGTAKNQKKWGTSGYAIPNTATCNTWTAKPGDVS